MKSKRRWLLFILPLALFAWAYQTALWRPKLVGVQPFQASSSIRFTPGGFSGPQILVSPDGRGLAAVAFMLDRNRLTMFATDSREKLWQRAEKDVRPFPLAFSPDNRFLVVVSDQLKTTGPSLALYLLDAATGQQIRPLLPSYNFGGAIESGAFVSPRELVVSTAKGASVVDIQTGKAIRQWRFRWPKPRKFGQNLPDQSHISTDGTTVLALAYSPLATTLVIYDSQTARQRDVWIYRSVFRNPRLSPDGTLWAMERTNSNVSVIHDTKTGQQLGVSFIGDTQSSPWSWSADSQNIVTPYLGNMVIADARTRRQIAEFYVAPDARALAFAPDGRALYTLDDKGKIWRWRAR